MTRSGIALLLVVCICFLALPSALACDGRLVFTSASELSGLVPLRVSPEADASVVCYFYTGVCFNALGHEDGWLAVRLDGLPFSDLPDGYIMDGGDDMYPQGYLAESDVYEVNDYGETGLCDGLLPKASLTAPANEPITLLKATGKDAAIKSIALPNAQLNLLGKMNDFFLVGADGCFGFVPESTVASDGRSKDFPVNVLWERPNYYDDFPLTFALVNPEKQNDNLPLYEKPDPTAGILAQCRCGTVVQILEDGKPYCRVRTVDHEGYMERAFLQVDGEPGKQLLTGIRDARPWSDFALHSFPDAQASIIPVEMGFYVDVLGIAGSWYYVRFYAGDWSQGVFQGYVRPDEQLIMGVGTHNGPMEYATVLLPENMPKLPLYAEASLDSDILGYYFSATQVRVLDDAATELWRKNAPYKDKDENNRLFIPVHVDGQDGYMLADYLFPMERSNPSQW